SGRNGRLRVALTHQGGQLELIVEDNGPGLSSDFDLESSATLGLTLITSLARQLFGSVTAESLGSGARFTLRFPLEEA
ncbi:MAG: histidine kinase, partial [Desulfovibrio sp.]|nr:histidine kinase [Desulfovibrio sp.]